MTARETAIRVLYEVEKNKAYSNIALKKVLGCSNLSTADNAFATELVYGAVRHKMRLDFIISHYSTQKLKNLSPWILCILYIGVYQILFLDKIPHFAAINESVTLAKRYGHAASARFVNAVLRVVAKGGEVKIPSIEHYYSHPKWLVDMLREQYPDDYKKHLAANNTPAPITIRVNTLKITADRLCDMLIEKGIHAQADGDIITISKFGNIVELDEYKKGLFIPQDKGAYLATLAVAPQPNQLILDVCAAPGAKTTQLAQLSNDMAEIVAFDIHPHKIELIQKNAQRMGINSITAIEFDATTTNNNYIAKADRVLADVPGSGLGIIRRKPDIKWLRIPTDIELIIKTQKLILQTSAQYVKQGGYLVYSTCTVNKHENGDIIDDFLSRHPFCKLEERQLLPHVDQCDGFYYCKMRRE
ncbi:MAG: 16S rRNA (cytosine(967)-C(5))-methyltransferase RsmB [Clostridiaceae bacterium]|nr:16S rRNA (cytosine(967)-C(5))-methyltransferase RsmB [Clostridiaceae bacterium]